MALSTPQILTYLSLKGIGPKAIQSLFQYSLDNSVVLTTPTDVADFINLCISHKIISRIKEPFDLYDIQSALSDTYTMLDRSEKLGIKVISIADELFPTSLKSIVDSKGKSNSPVVLHIKGNSNVLNMDNAIAIIGTREPTKAGVQAGLMFSEQFAKAGFNIVSGLAIGCDTTAHQGALKVNGITTAFVASGLDMPIYPSENTRLAEEIVEKGGALISEYSIGEPLMANRFVERDRLQSGLSNATLAIQTGIKGGTLHAVNATLDNGKPLYMVQYKGEEISHEKVQGNQMYIQSGKAAPLTRDNVEDVIQSLLKKKQTSTKGNQLSLFD